MRKVVDEGERGCTEVESDVSCAAKTYRDCRLFVQVWLGVGIFFFNDTATTEIYTLSLHDALPI